MVGGLLFCVEWSYEVWRSYFEKFFNAEPVNWRLGRAMPWRTLYRCKYRAPNGDEVRRKLVDMRECGVPCEDVLISEVLNACGCFLAG